MNPWQPKKQIRNCWNVYNNKSHFKLPWSTRILRSITPQVDVLASWNCAWHYIRADHGILNTNSTQCHNGTDTQRGSLSIRATQIIIPGNLLQYKAIWYAPYPSRMSSLLKVIVLVPTICPLYAPDSLLLSLPGHENHLIFSEECLNRPLW